MRTCTDIVRGHTGALMRNVSKAADATGWRLRHCKAWSAPQNDAERALRALLEAFALYADAYHAQNERALGDDGYFHVHAADMVRAFRAMLNFDCGRFDCGTLDKLISDIAQAASIEVDQ
jgi:hypothetical protein